MTVDPTSLLNTRSVCPPLGSWASPRDAYGTRRAPAMDSQKSPESAPSVPPEGTCVLSHGADYLEGQTPPRRCLSRACEVDDSLLNYAPGTTYWGSVGGCVR